MQLIESNIELFRFFVRQADERTRKLFMDRGDVDAANFMVLDRLEQGVQAQDVAGYRRRCTGPVEEAEISEGVLLLTKAVIRKVSIDGRADLNFGIYALFGILDLWNPEYFEFFLTPDGPRIESTFEFERKYNARVRVKQNSLMRDDVACAMDGDVGLP
jgi:hypothetical protein